MVIPSRLSRFALAARGLSGLPVRRGLLPSRGCQAVVLVIGITVPYKDHAHGALPAGRGRGPFLTGYDV